MLWPAHPQNRSSRGGQLLLWAAVRGGGCVSLWACMPTLYATLLTVCSAHQARLPHSPPSPQGQVFPRMRNFTPNHRMTGVGNALKRHYQVFLLEYEQVGRGCKGAVRLRRHLRQTVLVRAAGSGAAAGAHSLMRQLLAVVASQRQHHLAVMARLVKPGACLAATARPLSLPT